MDKVQRKRTYIEKLCNPTTSEAKEYCMLGFIVIVGLISLLLK